MAAASTNVIKRGGIRPSEQFTSDKLHASVLAACLSVHSPEGMAETAAKSVVDVVKNWLSIRPEVTSHDLRRVASDHLEQIHPEAGYLYKHHALVL